MNKGLILRNMSSRFVGMLVNRGVRLLLVPLQLNLLGEQAYGLLGLYSLIAGMAALLDLGLSQAANREAARFSGANSSGMRISDLVRTFELPYWLVGTVLAAGLLGASAWLADNWIVAPGMQRETVILSVKVIGVLLAVRWPVSLYVGILYGLQKQVPANVVAVAVDLLYGIGTVVVLLVKPRIELVLLWQLAVGGVEVLGYALLTWYMVRDRSGRKPHFEFGYIRQVWRFALGVNMVSIFGTVFSRADSLILSKLFPVSYLGYYSIAQRAPMASAVFSGVMIPATTPVAVAFHEQNDTSALARLYHKQARWLAFASVLVSLPLAAYSYPILRLWTQSERAAEVAAIPMLLVALGGALETISNSANQLSLACGATRAPVLLSGLMGAVVVAGTLALAPHYGIVGAAVAWTLARLLRFILFPVFVHRKLLPGEMGRWFTQDSLPALLLGALVFGIGRILNNVCCSESPWAWIAFLAGSLVAYIGMAVFLNLVPDWREMAAVAQSRVKGATACLSKG